jgi:hypothetical protein
MCEYNDAYLKGYPKSSIFTRKDKNELERYAGERYYRIISMVNETPCIERGKLPKNDVNPYYIYPGMLKEIVINDVIRIGNDYSVQIDYRQGQRSVGLL